MSRIYFHIDLNAFFANAEVLIDPSLKGKPVAVSGTFRRSVVSTASYEARSFGVHSAMPIAEALKKCPNLTVVPGHYSYYEELSNEFMKIVESYSSEVEQASIDECYADMTDAIQRYAKPLDLAWKIQKQIKEELGLSCSIGVAPNMFLAKMASDMKKPMGITVLRIREVGEKLWPLPISEMRGVGKKTVPYLEDLDIHTIGDLANYKDLLSLKMVLGKNTEDMIRKANGYDDRTIQKDWDSKSIGISETLLEDVTDYEEIRGVFRRCARELSRRMKEDRKAGSLISIRLKYYDFRCHDRSMQLDHSIWGSDDLFVYAMQLFDENWDGEPLRLVGISVSNFATDNMVLQKSLFDEETNQQEETIHVLADLNHQVTGSHFMRASDLLKEHE